LKAKIADREENFTIIDVRQKPDYMKAHLPDAINIPVDDIAVMVPRLVPNLWEDIVVYCGAPECDLSQKAAQLLVDLGYKDVNRFTGGVSDWIGGDLPVERDERLEDRVA
jgi:rhodanese-related sulfurtransferase